MGKRLFEGIEYIKNCILDAIYDEEEGVCPGCGGYTSSSILCPKCMRSIVVPSGSYEISRDGLCISSYSGAYYKDIIKDMVIGFKYNDKFRSGEFLGQLMYECAMRFGLDKADVITYVPMSRGSKRKRGFNQSRYLAEILGDMLHIDVEDLLKKEDEGETQKKLNADERWKNAEGNYGFKGSKNDIRDKNIILVDDVLTTGATAFYCSKALLENGAGKVMVLTAAKSRI